jgi:hypothetical protein
MFCKPVLYLPHGIVVGAVNAGQLNKRLSDNVISWCGLQRICNFGETKSFNKDGLFYWLFDHEASRLQNATQLAE